MESRKREVEIFHEGESPRVSGQPTPRDAVDRIGEGRSEGAKVDGTRNVHAHKEKLHNVY